MAAGYRIDVDASEVQEVIERYKSVLRPEKVELAAERALRRTGGHVKRILKADLPKAYRVMKNKEIGPAVRPAQIHRKGGALVVCTIPIKGRLRAVGGSIKASGSAAGWESLHKKYRVRAYILQGAASVLPERMPARFGGNPPFRNSKAPKLNGVTFTRATRKQYPILKISGIAVPQMPPNRSEREVTKDVQDYAVKRLEHELDWMLGGKGK